MKTRIVAFMQNPWFPAGTSREKIHAYKTVQRYHQDVLKETMSGYRLIQAFGEEMFRRIYWDNVAPEPADNARGVTPVDMKHVEAIIAVNDPHLILTFGKVAEDTLKKSVASINRHMMHCHHPNARSMTQSDLDIFAWQVWDWVNLHDRNDEFTAGDKDESTN
ncbi:protein (G:T/u specific DNA glycosylasE)-glycosylasE [Caudoviricetes sp.]|nr:protein (G:T/u specific DNA glycosylasE)-glycosylasE [Caudoviricetes sp.]